MSSFKFYSENEGVVAVSPRLGCDRNYLKWNWLNQSIYVYHLWSIHDVFKKYIGLSALQSMRFISGSGNYMYLETSGLKEYDTADLLSPSLPPGQDYCLRLYTNMYGNSTGDITILTEVMFGRYTCI